MFACWQRGCAFPQEAVTDGLCPVCRNPLFEALAGEGLLSDPQPAPPTPQEPAPPTPEEPAEPVTDPAAPFGADDPYEDFDEV